MCSTSHPVFRPVSFQTLMEESCLALCGLQVKAQGCSPSEPKTLTRQLMATSPHSPTYSVLIRFSSMALHISPLCHSRTNCFARRWFFASARWEDGKIQEEQANIGHDSDLTFTSPSAAGPASPAPWTSRVSRMRWWCLAFVITFVGPIFHHSF